MKKSQDETGSTRRANSNEKAGPRSFFSKEEIVSAAMAIIYERGHESLSMRALASRLGTGPATIYNYFPSQSEVEEAVVDRMLADVHPPSHDKAASIRDQLIEMGEAYRNLILHHPQFDQISARVPGGSAIRLMNATLRALTEAGVPIERAGLSYAVLRAIAHNQAITSRAAKDANLQKVRQGWISALPATDTDHIKSYFASPLFKGTAEEVFRRSLGMAIDALLPEIAGTAGKKRR